MRGDAVVTTSEVKFNHILSQAERSHMILLRSVDCAAI